MPVQAFSTWWPERGEGDLQMVAQRVAYAAAACGVTKETSPERGRAAHGACGADVEIGSRRKGMQGAGVQPAESKPQRLGYVAAQEVDASRTVLAQKKEGGSGG